MDQQTDIVRWDGGGAGPDYRRARELLWMAAHDLAAPLGAIRMHVRARETSSIPLGEGDWIAILGSIDRLAAGALRLVDDVLAVERLQNHPLETTPPERIDAEKILGEAIATQALALERVGCSVFVRRRDDLDRVIGRWSASALGRLFSNLLENVVLHAPGAPIEISFARREEQLQIRFADGGPGRSDARPSREAFADASSSSESGHGLGLWIVYRTVTEMGGVVTMQSRAGKGLAFDIRLPFEV